MKTKVQIEKIKAEVREIFTAFLEQKKQRRTPERYAILDEIYSKKAHFDVDTLYIQMKNRNYHVSRATVYNTLDLLLDCGLVTKHQFGENMAQYEQAFGFVQHDHLICVKCRKVSEFCDPRIQQIQSKIGDILRFNITHHSLTFYGTPVITENHCESCKLTVEEIENIES